MKPHTSIARSVCRRITVAAIPIFLLTLPFAHTLAQSPDSIPHPLPTVSLSENSSRPSLIKRIIQAFDEIDSSYIEPIPYNYTAMLQATRNLEYYTIGSNDYASRLSFAEKNNLRIGPYFGWRWIFLGYTFDVMNLGKKSKNRGVNLDLSFYTSKLGFDLFYHRTGPNFQFRRIEGLGENAKLLEGEPCEDYINTNLIGLKIYYNFNSTRYSNQAIYSQSTIQRRSAGSFQLGASFTYHDVHFNYQALPAQMAQEANSQQAFLSLERVKYNDYSVHIGYAYNFVFARNWCLGMSLMPALALTWTSTKTAIIQNQQQDTEDTPQDTPFYTKIYDSFRRQAALGLDCTARAGIIYNNGRWFTGVSTIIHNFNYRRNHMRFSNTFGTANLFVGFYFQKRKPKSMKTQEVELPQNSEQPVIEY